MIVLALGGSVFFAYNPKRFAEVLNEYGGKIAIVVGGGKTARDYISLAREMGGDETTCDMIGIEVTRINARILAIALEDCSPIIPKDFEEAYILLKTHKKIVMGGTFPGHTTDATAALLAEYLRAKRLLIATAVDGVYDKDPKKSRDAVKFDKLSYDKLVEIVSKTEAKAGGSSVIDLLAAKIIQRSGIETLVFKGSPENIRRALKGEKVGTIVSQS